MSEPSIPTQHAAPIETTPLLPNPVPTSQDESQIPVSRNSDSKAMSIFTWASITLSALTFGYTLTFGAWGEFSPYGSHLDWATRECFFWIMNLSVLSAFSLMVNLARKFKGQNPLILLLTIVFDFFFIGYSLGMTSRILDEVQYSPYCHPLTLDQPSSADFGEICRPPAVGVLIYIAAGLGVALCLIHAGFFLRTCVLVVRKVWQGCGTWRVPTGQLTFEFTIKVLRQDESSLRQERRDTAVDG